MNDNVKAEKFYQDNGDKIKINWFCYEYANILYSSIKSSKKLEQYRKHHSPAQIADFSLFFSKRMKKSIRDRETGKRDAVVIDEQYVYEYYPKCLPKQVQALIEAAETAWDEMLFACSICPSSCLSEGYELTPMFDNLATTDWLT